MLVDFSGDSSVVSVWDYILCLSILYTDRKHSSKSVTEWQAIYRVFFKEDNAVWSKLVNSVIKY
jgi:hypothetical protein